MSPARYLHMLRMRQAQELLETTFLTVKEITAQVGLRGESHFVQAFKRVYGSTPVEYRHACTSFHSDSSTGPIRHSQ